MKRFKEEKKKERKYDRNKENKDIQEYREDNSILVIEKLTDSEIAEILNERSEYYFI